MFIKLIIKTKTKNSLKNLLKNFNEFFNKHNFIKIYTVISKKKNQKKFFFLKSPHIYKKAKEQFLFHIYTKELIIYTFDKEKSFLLLKKKFEKLHSDVVLDIKMILSKKLEYNLNFFMHKKLKLNYYDIFGETCFSSILTKYLFK